MNSQNSIHNFLGVSKMKKQQSKGFTVCVPQAFVVVGALDVIVFGLFIVLSSLIWPDESAKNRITFYVVFGLFVLLGIYMIVKALRFRIVVKNEQIKVTPVATKSFVFTFDDIEIVKRQVKKRYNKGQAERIIIQTKQGKKLAVDSSYVSYRKLVERIIETVEKSKLIGEW